MSSSSSQQLQQQQQQDAGGSGEQDAESELLESHFRGYVGCTQFKSRNSLSSPMQWSYLEKFLIDSWLQRNGKAADQLLEDETCGALIRHMRGLGIWSAVFGRKANSIHHAMLYRPSMKDEDTAILAHVREWLRSEEADDAFQSTRFFTTLRAHMSKQGLWWSQGQRARSEGFLRRRYVTFLPTLRKEIDMPGQVVEPVIPKADKAEHRKAAAAMKEIEDEARRVEELEKEQKQKEEEATKKREDLMSNSARGVRTSLRVLSKERISYKEDDFLADIEDDEDDEEEEDDDDDDDDEDYVDGDDVEQVSFDKHPRLKKRRRTEYWKDEEKYPVQRDVDPKAVTTNPAFEAFLRARDIYPSIQTARQRGEPSHDEATVLRALHAELLTADLDPLPMPFKLHVIDILAYCDRHIPQNDDEE